VSPSPRGSAGCGSVAEGGDRHEVGELLPAILHVDMDAFFAAVEVLDDPALAGRPVIVGGSGARGVVASCTYEARAFGVRSAMPSVRARSLCPDAVFVDGHYGRYAEVSGRLREILVATTPLVEPIGLDEAFCDVTGARRLLGPPEAIAHQIRQRVHDELALDCSVGVGRSKLVAKLASRAAKPVASRAGKQPGRGVVVVGPGEELAFLHPLPVEALWGVGPATAKRLHDLGVRTVGQLAALPPDALVRKLGKAQGSHLAALARAQDDDPVVADRAAKSVGHEETFRHDVVDPVVLRDHVVRMSESVAVHLRSSAMAARTVTVKVKYADFSLVTRSHTLPVAVDTAMAVSAVAEALLSAVDPGPGVRLLGVSVSGLEAPADVRQLAFALDPHAPGGQDSATPDLPREAVRLQTEWAEVTGAVDAIRARFGRESVGTASMVGDEGIVVPARRDAPWGPGEEDPAS